MLDAPAPYLLVTPPYRNDVALATLENKVMGCRNGIYSLLDQHPSGSCVVIISYLHTRVQLQQLSSVYKHIWPHHHLLEVVRHVQEETAGGLPLHQLQT